MSRWQKWRKDTADADLIAAQSDSDDGGTSYINNQIDSPHSQSDWEERVETIQQNNDESSDVSDVDSNFLFQQSVESESSDESENEKFNLNSNLTTWAIKNKITRSSLTELLGILRGAGHTDLPKDARTLLQTPKNIDIENKCGGKYTYLGIENGLRNVFSRNQNFVKNIKNIDLKINVDGLPLFKSTSDSLWPILAYFDKNISPFIVALYYGKEKPDSVTNFTSDFLEEWDNLRQFGIRWGDQHFNLFISCFICDAPARCFLKCIKGHTGYYACERCTVRGSWNGRVVYDTVEQDIVPRTDEIFLEMGYQADGHQNNISVLGEYGIKCISNFVLDYMHLVCLGVVKRVLHYLKNGPRQCKLGGHQISAISAKLKSFQGLLPSEFARQPRGLNELERWKATEYRQFLLYTGPVVLKKVLSYTHFLTLTVAMSILLSTDPATRNANVDYADQLLLFFVKNCNKIYGGTFNVYNIHNLVHLADDVRTFDCSLNEISAFPFENYLQCIKKSIRNSNNPIAQVVKRQRELESADTEMEFSTCKPKFKINTTEKNKYFLLTSSAFCIIREIRADNMFLADILNLKQTEPFFDSPCSSKLLNIVFVRNFNGTKRRLVEYGELQRKVVCLPHNDTTSSWS
ncbi:hypothetical protein SNE40_002965 [Patella caerulea]|uniref:Transposase domain-containing protein n=1 Tax=Patella caerulea TaxID=87958 RepID=A0AAN8KF13_PATCE